MKRNIRQGGITLTPLGSGLNGMKENEVTDKTNMEIKSKQSMDSQSTDLQYFQHVIIKASNIILLGLLNSRYHCHFMNLETRIMHRERSMVSKRIYSRDFSNSIWKRRKNLLQVFFNTCCLGRENILKCRLLISQKKNS